MEHLGDPYDLESTAVSRHNILLHIVITKTGQPNRVPAPVFARNGIAYLLNNRTGPVRSIFSVWQLPVVELYLKPNSTRVVLKPSTRLTFGRVLLP